MLQSVLVPPEKISNPMCCCIELFRPYKTRIEESLVSSMPYFGPPASLLRDAVEHALMGQGKRVRSALVFALSDAIGNNNDVTDSALAVEYFHTASLIADDLPCMDDEKIRRGRAALDKKYGESTAILSTYALIAAGYDRIRINGQKNGKENLISVAIENIAKNTGAVGAVAGQLKDLFCNEWDEATILEVIDKKTGTLFEVSFVLGWLFGGGDLAALNTVKELGVRAGRIFQIRDDFLDEKEDLRGVNFICIAGRERAERVLEDESERLRFLLKSLDKYVKKRDFLAKIFDGWLVYDVSPSKESIGFCDNSRLER